MRYEGTSTLTVDHPEAHTATAPSALDHVALWVADPEGMAAFLCDHLGMQVIDSRDGFRLVGAEAARGKLALSAAEGPTQPGVLSRVVLRVSDLEGALAALPKGVAVDRPAPDIATFEGPEGLGLGLTPVLGGVDYDIDHVVLRVAALDDTAAALTELGFVPRGGSLHVADKQVRLEQQPTPPSDRPVLGRLGLVVESVEAVEAQARRRGLEVERAEDRLALVVRGFERIRLEYIEERPGFAPA
jgi:catechol 2,3-dioxygenase-like lactoylglutathione lyase family enzyme